MCSASELQTILYHVAQAYHRVFGNRIEQILLYGSYARWTNDEESDIDLVAIVHGDRRELQDKLKKVWDISSDLELEYGIIISPTVIPYEEYMKYKADLPYYRNISQEGIPIASWKSTGTDALSPFYGKRAAWFVEVAVGTCEL